MLDARPTSDNALRYISQRNRKIVRSLRPLQKCATWLLLWSFLFTNIFDVRAWAVPDSIGLTSVGSARAGGPGILKELRVETFSLPEYLGRIKDTFEVQKIIADSNRHPEAASGPQDTDKQTPIVVHIQDAHCNYAAQHKIHDIISYLNKEYGISTINLEGGARDYNLSIFTKIADKKIREQVSDNFVKEGLVNGAEYFAINNPDKVTLWGIEDVTLYKENLAIYRDSLTYKETVDKELRSIGRILSMLKTCIYSKELFEFDLKYTSYKANNLEFKDYLSYIVNKAREKGIEIKEYPNIDLLCRAIEREPGLDFKKANEERDTLIDKLQKRLSRSLSEELILKTLEFKTERISQHAFYNYLIKTAQSVGVSIEEFTQLHKYITYTALYEATDKVKAVEEMGELEEKLKDTMCENNVQSELNILSKNITLLKNIFSITLTKDDYRYYINNKAGFDISNFAAFIKNYSPIYKITDVLDDKIYEIDNYREKISEFYEYSLRRDEAFVKNLRVPSLKPTVAIVVTGGFHTENLCALFKTSGISYISIIPNFKTPGGYECPYFRLLAGEMSALEKRLYAVAATTVSGSALALYTFLSAAMPQTPEDRLRELVFSLRVQQSIAALKEKGIVITYRDAFLAVKPGADDRNIIEGKFKPGEDARSRFPDLTHIDLAKFTAEYLNEGASKEALGTMPLPQLYDIINRYANNAQEGKRTFYREALKAFITRSQEILKASGDFLALDPNVKGAVTEKLGLHLAMKELDKNAHFLITTSEPSGFSDMNAKYGHEMTDAICAKFGEETLRYITGKSQAEDVIAPRTEIPIPGELRAKGVTAQFVAMYKPYGGRWHHIFSIEGYAEISNAEKQLLEESLHAYFTSMIDSATKAAQTLDKSGDTRFASITDLDKLHFLMGISKIRPPVKIDETSKEFAERMNMISLNRAHEYTRKHPDIFIDEKIAAWLAEKTTSPPETALAELLKFENKEELIKSLRAETRQYYYKDYLQNTIQESRKLITYAENEYYPNIGKTAYASRIIRGTRGIFTEVKSQNSEPTIDVFTYLTAPQGIETSDRWISSHEGSEVFSYFGIPERIPNYSELNRQKSLVRNEIDRLRQAIDATIAKNTDAEPALIASLASAYVALKNMVSREMELATLSPFDLNQGASVINTLTELIMKQGNGIVRINGDFDFLSKVKNIKVGDKIKREGMKILSEEFGKIGITIAQKGAGDEWVGLGAGTVKAGDIHNAVKNINTRMSRLTFDNVPIVYDVPVRRYAPGPGNLTEVTEPWRPSISCGFAYETDPARLETLDSRSEEACKRAKGLETEETKKGAAFGYDQIPKEERTALDASDIAIKVPDDLLPFTGLNDTALNLVPSIAVENRPAANEHPVITTMRAAGPVVVTKDAELKTVVLEQSNPGILTPKTCEGWFAMMAGVDKAVLNAALKQDKPALIALPLSDEHINMIFEEYARYAFAAERDLDRLLNLRLRLGNIEIMLYNDSERSESGRKNLRERIRNFTTELMQNGADADTARQRIITFSYRPEIASKRTETDLENSRAIVAGSYNVILDGIRGQTITPIGTCGSTAVALLDYFDALKTRPAAANLDNVALCFAALTGSDDYAALAGKIVDENGKLLSSGLITIKIQPIDFNKDIAAYYAREAAVLKSL